MKIDNEDLRAHWIGVVESRARNDAAAREAWGRD